MTTRTAHSAALVLSVVMTLGIFSGVSQLYSPAHPAAVLAAAEPAPHAPHAPHAQHSRRS